MFLFLIPTTLLFPAFWQYQRMEHKMLMINFVKNLAIMGRLALLVGLGPGPLSIDRRKVDRPCESWT